ncbi:hypothetical protein ScPMuIL_000219 [Solemya velum]
MAHSKVMLKKEMTVVLVGMTGEGKSATGNTLLTCDTGHQVFKSAFQAASVTKICQNSCTEIHGASLCIIDTPGFFDTGMAEDAVKRSVARCLAMATPGPHAFLLVISLDHPFDRNAEYSVQRIIELFDKEILNYIIIIFTHKGRKTITEYISENPSITNYLTLCSNRYVEIENSEKNEHRKILQMDAVLEELNHLYEHNNGEYFSNHLTDGVNKLYEEFARGRIATGRDDTQVKTLYQRVGTSGERSCKDKFTDDETWMDKAVNIIFDLAAWYAPGYMYHGTKTLVEIGRKYLKDQFAIVKNPEGGAD